MNQASGFGLRASATGGNRSFLADRRFCLKRDRTRLFLPKSEVRSPKPLPSRPGYTLTELMVVITFFSLLMVMATRLIVLMYASERASRSRVVTAIGLDRLAHQFQRDVRSAEKVLHVRRAPAAGEELPPSRPPGRPRQAVLLRLQVGGAVVEYAAADGFVARSVLPADDHSQVAKEREQFHLSDAAHVEIELEPSAAAHQVLSLTVRESGPGAADDTPRGRDVPRLKVQAVRGRDLRFVQPTAKEGT